MSTSDFPLQLLRNARKELLNLADIFFEENKKYRPTAEYRCKTYHETIVDPEFKYIEIYPNHVSRVAVPDIMLKELSPYYLNDELDLKDRNTLKTRDTYFVVDIPYGRVYTNNVDTIAYITFDKILLSDISLQWRFYKSNPPNPRNGIFEKVNIPTPIKINGTVFSLLAGETSKNNYSHWFLDAFSRIHLLKQSGLFDEVDYFLVSSIKNDFQRQSLQLIGIPDEKIIEADSNTHIYAKRLIATSHPRGKQSHITPEWVINFYRKTFTNSLTSYSKYSPFVYINRKDAKHRKVENEAALEEMLEKYGFASYSLADISMEEKIKLFNSAKIVVSITGAGLQNLTFCKKGTGVIELFPGNLVHTIFCDIAQKAGLVYHPIIYKSGTKLKTHLDCVRENITVDIPSFEKTIREVVSKTEKEVF
jgi:hypothetical protein